LQYCRWFYAVLSLMLLIRAGKRGFHAKAC
jgi:hypothetical protein